MIAAMSRRAPRSIRLKRTARDEFDAIGSRENPKASWVEITCGGLPDLRPSRARNRV